MHDYKTLVRWLKMFLRHEFCCQSVSIYLEFMKDETLSFKICVTDNKYDSILFDINTDDASLGMSCPPKAFVEEKFLAHVKECLTKRGKLYY